jgi:hypothetical protein
MLKENDPGKKNGALKPWMDDQLIISRPNMRFRDVPEVKISRFTFTAYFGGGSSDHLAEEPTSLY